MTHALNGKRILVTQVETFMGPAICEELRAQGAEVIPHEGALISSESCSEAIAAAGEFDILIANLAIAAPTTRATEVTDEEWSDVFEALVHPLPRLARAVLPNWQERGSGKIIVVGSASALRGINRTSTYCAARGAQLSWVQAVGIEMAQHGIQVNCVAQNFVENPSYFPQEVQENPRFQERLKREVPLGRLVTAKEDVSLIAYLCSDVADCFVGQAFPMCGGWVNR
ncbi:SDR family oxidoreductase [Halioglobus maricola]|uniref:SDR family oxidoreductase n=1 Tax=Halioglobus maricola TaxID=2601894 RepID=A0A5P9NI16_9GAMM|nr:SDR family oxidoreductase [Halioglobus maricola]QFU75441.1 SDR family oxidoreductase [Halioglobus maricola]